LSSCVSSDFWKRILLCKVIEALLEFKYLHEQINITYPLFLVLDSVPKECTKLFILVHILKVSNVYGFSTGICVDCFVK